MMHCSLLFGKRCIARVIFYKDPSIVCNNITPRVQHVSSFKYTIRLHWIRRCEENLISSID